jgi:hypothetical protein
MGLVVNIRHKLFKLDISLSPSNSTCSGRMQHNGTSQNQILLWCCSLSHRYFCIVAVQHSHSGKIGLRKKMKILPVKILFLCVATMYLGYNLSFLLITKSECLVQVPPSNSEGNNCSCPVLKDFSSWHSCTCLWLDILYIVMIDHHWWQIHALSGNGKF